MKSSYEIKVIEWGELNGDEDEVELTWEELEILDEQEADIQNDADWLDGH